MKLAKNLENLGTETAFAVLAEAKKTRSTREAYDSFGFGSARF